MMVKMAGMMMETTTTMREIRTGRQADDADDGADDGDDDEMVTIFFFSGTSDLLQRSATATSQSHKSPGRCRTNLDDLIPCWRICVDGQAPIHKL